MRPPNTRNSETLNSFVDYCLLHPELRFWQALQNWAGVNFVLTAELLPHEISKNGNLVDTYYWEGKKS